jgi:hypothetical protein
MESLDNRFTSQVNFKGIYFSLCIGECPSNSPFLKNNGGIKYYYMSKLSIIFKEWRVVNNMYRGEARV